MTGRKDNTLCIDQDRKRNIVSIHRATKISTSWSHCYRNGTAGAKVPAEQEPRLENNSNTGRDGNDNTYVFLKIVRHIASGLSLKFLIRYYGFSKTDKTASPHQIPQYCIYASRRRFEKRRKTRPNIRDVYTSTFKMPAYFRKTLQCPWLEEPALWHTLKQPNQPQWWKTFPAHGLGTFLPAFRTRIRN